MNRYESYKDSGIPWLGDVPEHWDVSRLKYEVTFNDEVLSDKTDLDYEILYVDISSVSINQGIAHKELMTFENSPSRARRIVRSGDVIVSTVRTYLKAIAQINNAEENLIVSTGFAVLRHKAELSPKFLGYWIQSENMINAIVAHSVGVSYPAINSTDLVRLPIVKIPLPEQTAIADYLDNKLGEIDALISKQETLLAKLAEQRTAMITHAVTKGLNANAPMKNSGVAWLGEVPEHWEVKRLKYSIQNISNKIEAQMSNLRYFGLENIQSFTGNLLTDIELESEGIANEFKENDVLFGKLRPYLAKVHLTTQQGLISTEALVFRPNVEIKPKFLFYFCVSSDFIDAVNGTTFGSKMPRASWDDIGSFKMLIPSKEEQTAIADYLDEQTAKIDRLSDTVNQAIARLKEYRSALITQAVTGKIKVI